MKKNQERILLWRSMISGRFLYLRKSFPEPEKDVCSRIEETLIISGGRFLPEESRIRQGM